MPFDPMKYVVGQQQSGFDPNRYVVEQPTTLLTQKMAVENYSPEVARQNIAAVPTQSSSMTGALEAIRGNPQEQGALSNVVRGAATLGAQLLPPVAALSYLEQAEQPNSNIVKPIGGMIGAMANAYKRQFTGDAEGMTRGEAWQQQPIEEASNLAMPILAALGVKRAVAPKATAFIDMMKKGAGTVPAATELGVGFNPLKYVGDKLKEKGLNIGKVKDNFANPLGTPEVVLKGQGIVEPFRDQAYKMNLAEQEMMTRLKPAFKGVTEDSPLDHRLFKKLNTPGAKLTPREQIIRNHLDDLFKRVNEARRMRGQAEIPYREGYITHLIEGMPKEFSADLQIPKELRFRFSKRDGEQMAHGISAIKAVDVYTKAALKDIHTGNALWEARKPLNRLTKGQWAFNSIIKNEGGEPVSLTFRGKGNPAFFTKAGYAKSFVERQLGWPSKAARDIESLTGIKAQTTQRAALKITSGFYNSLLGLAVDSGIKNLTQGVHTIAELGLTPTLKGYLKLGTKSGFKGARAEHLLHEFEPFLLNESLPLKSQVAKVAASVLQSPMKFAEFVNRGAAFHAAMDVAIKKGMNPKAAHDYARSVVRKTQFAYGKMDVSPFMQGAITRPLAQFMTFPAKAGEMLWQYGKTKGERGKLLRYLATTGAIIMGGKYAGVDMSGIFIDPTKLVDPDSKQGVPLPGSDKRITLDPKRLGSTGFTPQGLSPVPGTIAKAVQYLSAEDTKKPQMEKDLLRSVIPGGRYGGKVYDYFTKDGETRDARNRLIRKDTGAEAFMKLTGFRSTDREVEQSKREAVANVEKDFNTRRQKIVDTFIAGDKAKAMQLRDELVKEYPYLAKQLRETLKGMIKSEAKKKNKTSDERFYESKTRQRIEQNL